MKLIRVECPNCNSSFDFEEGQTNLKCKYCGTDFSLEDKNIKIEHVLNNDKESKYKEAETLLKNGDFVKAGSLYKELTSEYSYDPEVWYNLLLCRTKYYDVDSAFSDLKVSEADEEKPDFSLYYKVMVSRFNEIFNTYSKLEEDKKLLEERTIKYNEFLSNLELKSKLFSKKLNSDYKKIKKESRIASFVGSLILYFPLIVLIVLWIIDTVNQKEKEAKVDIGCEIYCNDSIDGLNSLDEVSSFDSLYCHVKLTKGYKDYKYKLYSKIYIDHHFYVAKITKALGKGEVGLINLSADDENKIGRYKVVIDYDYDKTNLCSTEINVVDK